MSQPEKQERVRVLVVEDQPQILKSQLRLLTAAPELEVVGSALSGEAALESIEKTRPQVLLCDLGLPGMSGIEVTRQVKARWPTIEILIFTIFDEEEKVMDAIKAGASGYLLKGATAARIVEAICEVHGGGSVIQPNLARRLLTHFRVPDEETPMPQPVPGPLLDNLPRLTPREVEILRLIAKGLSNSEAAGVLQLSRATVRTHLEHIYEKLEVTNRVEAVTEGIRKGLIDVDS